MNQHAKYVGHRSLCSKCITQTYTTDQLLYLDH